MKNFLTDCCIHMFIFFTLDLFINSFAECRQKEKQQPTKVLFLIVAWILASVSYFENYWILVLLRDFLYIFLICKNRLKLKITIFFKYELYYFFSASIIAILHTILPWDMLIYKTNNAYANYTNIIGTFLLYISLNVYLILKKLSGFPSGKIYKHYFLGMIGSSVVLLVVCSLLSSSSLVNQEDIVPLLFTILLVIAMLCISIYHKIISVLEENTLAKIEIEKNTLEQNYYAQVQNGLKNLSLLRHDFKNHLAILNGYASSGRMEELQTYITKLSDELTPSTLITTHSQLLSAIINTKNEECKKKGITFTFEQQVNGIFLDDFHMVTIFSNMLDNAICAASKCPAGTIRLRLITIDSYLDIDCVNNHQEKIVKKDGRFLTTKPTHKELHGLGIQSIRKAVKALNGEIEIDHTEDSFHVNILVPNYR